MPCPDIKTCGLASGKKSCNHWLSFQVAERGTEVINVREDCTFNWLSIFLYDSNVKLLGIQQPTEQTRNLLDAAVNQRTKRIAR